MRRLNHIVPGVVLLLLACALWLSYAPPWGRTIRGVPVPGTEDLAGEVSWFALSPDGKWILLWTRRSEPELDEQDGFFLYDVESASVGQVDWTEEALDVVDGDISRAAFMERYLWTPDSDAAFLYTVPPGSSGSRWLRLDPATTPPRIHVPDDDQRTDLPERRPTVDSRLGVEGEGTSEVRIIDLERGGVVLRRFRFLSAYILGVDAAAISPDDDHVAVVLGGLGAVIATSWGPRAYLIDRDTGKAIRLRGGRRTQNWERFFPPLAFHPKRRLVYMYADTDRPRIYQWKY